MIRRHPEVASFLGQSYPCLRQSWVCLSRGFQGRSWNWATSHHFFSPFPLLCHLLARVMLLVHWLSGLSTQQQERLIVPFEIERFLPSLEVLLPADFPQVFFNQHCPPSFKRMFVAAVVSLHGKWSVWPLSAGWRVLTLGFGSGLIARSTTIIVCQTQIDFNFSLLKYSIKLGFSLFKNLV